MSVSFPDIKIYLAPLQGYTNSEYRNLHSKYFGGVDQYYSPYLRFETNKEFKKSVYKDIQPEQNEAINFVPQVLGTDTKIFIDLAKQFKTWNYKEINWNLGCPYPMVTKRGFGSALVQKPDKVKDILEKVIPQIDIPLSIKCRLGFEDDKEILALIEVLNQFPIKELTVHTRTAKQMYKGKTKPEAFNEIRRLCQHKLVYNGDINSISDLEQHYHLFEQSVDSFMLGRGLLMNPFLASEIKGKQYSEDEKREILRQFHNELFEISKEKLEPSHLLSRMQGHWEYLSFMFEEQRKVFKAIKKTKRIDKYEILIDQLMLKQKLSD